MISSPALESPLWVHTLSLPLDLSHPSHLTWSTPSHCAPFGGQGLGVTPETLAPWQALAAWCWGGRLAGRGREAALVTDADHSCLQGGERTEVPEGPGPALPLPCALSQPCWELGRLFPGFPPQTVMSGAGVGGRLLTDGGIQASKPTGHCHSLEASSSGGRCPSVGRED